MDRLRDSIRDLLSFAQQVPDLNQATAVNAAWRSTYGLIESLCLAEEQGVTRDKLRLALEPIRKLHSESPFMKRLQEWPRGYPGDFQTIELLYAQRNSSLPDTGAWFIEQIALASPMAQQHRNKIHFQRDLVNKALIEVDASRPAKIASVACGGSLDLHLSLLNSIDRDTEIYLLDVDEEALKLSQQRIDSKRTKIVVFQGDVIKATRQLNRHGPFDLVLVGGLLDYLQDKHALFVIKALGSSLALHGTLYASNIKNENPYQAWLENIASWSMIDRTQEQLMEIFLASGFSTADVHITAEPTGLTLLAVATGTPSKVASS